MATAAVNTGQKSAGPDEQHEVQRAERLEVNNSCHQILYSSSGTFIFVSFISLKKTKKAFGWATVTMTTESSKYASDTRKLL